MVRRGASQLRFDCARGGGGGEAAVGLQYLGGGERSGEVLVTPDCTPGGRGQDAVSPLRLSSQAELC